VKTSNLKKVRNCDVTHQGVWFIVKSVVKRDGPNNMSPKWESLCDFGLFRKPVNVSWPVWWKSWATMHTSVEALLTSVDDTLLENVRPCDILVNTLELRKAFGLHGMSNGCFRHLPRRPLVHLTYLFIHYHQQSDFPKPWRKQKL
jgi:hypothetical protein